MLADTEDSQEYGLDAVPIWKAVRRECWSSETMGKWKSEGDKGDMDKSFVLEKK